MMQSDSHIHGLSLDDMAAINAKHTEFVAQYGEPHHKPAFGQYLAQRQVSAQQWQEAWNELFQRMEADPSGQLYAQYAMIQKKYVHQAHFADVKDASQDAKHGVSLEVYAKIMAQAAAGKDMQQVVQHEGLSWSQWQQAQTAWNAAMGADVNHHLTTQYGQLYAKYTPGFEQNMREQVAATMAEQYALRGHEDDEPEKEYTFSDMVLELGSPLNQVRWDAANHVITRWDCRNGDTAELTQATRQAYQQCLECLAQYDDKMVSEAGACASNLAVLAGGGFFDSSELATSQQAIAGGLERAHARLQHHEAILAPIANQAVPERVSAQMNVQDFRGLVEDMQEILEEWSEHEAAGSRSSAQAPSTSSASFDGPTLQTSLATTNESASPYNAFIQTLKTLPLIGSFIKIFFPHA